MALAILVGVLLAFAINRWLVTITEVTSDSMAPTLQVGETALVWRPGAVQRGDIVLFDGRGSFVGSDHPPVEYLKRVVAVAGDRVSCCQAGKVTVNGTPIEEPYVPAAAADDLAFDVQVPPERLWVMGDNRNRSSDSRAHIGDPGGGFVPTSRVQGTVRAVIWPPSAARSVS